MPDLEQWVNLTRHTKWFGDGLTDVERTTESVKVTVQFDQRARATGFLSVQPASGNCTYTATEIPRRNAIFTLPNFNMRQFQTDDTGKFETNINVGSAGGNDFTITVKDGSGNELKSDVIKTRRKLYFQIIRMTNVTEPTAAAVTAMKSQFWNVAKKIYLKVVEFASGRTIASTVLYDRTQTSQVNALKRAARAVYDNSKVPNAFVAVMVNKIGDSTTDHIDEPITLGSGNYTFEHDKTLIDAADPGANWYVRLVWTKTGGSAQTIPKAKCTRSGNNSIVIDTSGLATGAGRITGDVKILSWSGGGLSYGRSNFTVIGTKYTLGGSFSSPFVSAILVHEIGHKIGMVPGTQSDRVLDVQTATHYSENGNHCGHGLTRPYPTPSVNGASGISPDCTMFGNASTVNTSTFCDECLKSLRKLDLRGSNNIGLSNQF